MSRKSVRVGTTTKMKVEDLPEPIPATMDDQKVKAVKVGVRGMGFLWTDLHYEPTEDEKGKVEVTIFNPYTQIGDPAWGTEEVLNNHGHIIPKRRVLAQFTIDRSQAVDLFEHLFFSAEDIRYFLKDFTENPGFLG